MINEFKGIPARDSAIVYQTSLEQIQSLYELDPEMAGELAISVIELALTGEISSDNKMIAIMLKQTAYTAQKNAQAWNDKKESAREKKKKEQNLEMIARLHKEGLTQKNIGTRLGVSQQTIGNRLALIKREYPELLVKENDESSEKEHIAQVQKSTVDKEIFGVQNNEIDTPIPDFRF